MAWGVGRGVVGLRVGRGVAGRDVGRGVVGTGLGAGPGAGPSQALVQNPPSTYTGAHDTLWHHSSVMSARSPVERHSQGSSCFADVGLGVAGRGVGRGVSTSAGHHAVVQRAVSP